MSDGRIQLDSAKQYPSFERVAEFKRSTVSAEKTLLQSNMSSTPVSKLFFSRTNIDALQLGLKNLVYTKSCKKHRIGNQSEDELMTIMRAIFLQNAKNIPYNVVEQVRELNQLVLVYAVPRILNEIEMYQTYLKDATSGPTYWERGQATSVKGTKTLELSKRWV